MYGLFSSLSKDKGISIIPMPAEKKLKRIITSLRCRLRSLENSKGVISMKVAVGCSVLLLDEMTPRLCHYVTEIL